MGEYEKLAVATYSVRKSLKSMGIDGISDYLIGLGIKNVEMNNIFFTPENLVENARKFTGNGITPFQLTIDGNNFFQSKTAARNAQFEFMKKWVDPAHEAGITTIRANMGHKKGFIFNTATLTNIIDTFRPIMEYIEKLGMNFVFENHGGKSSDIDFQLAVKKEFPSPKFGYLVDFGNYRPKKLIYDNILKLKDTIIVAHGKAYNFNEDGTETQLDYEKIITNLKQVGFNGFYSIEYEGPLPDLEGTKKTLELIKRYL